MGAQLPLLAVPRKSAACSLFQDPQRFLEATLQAWARPSQPLGYRGLSVPTQAHARSLFVHFSLQNALSSRQIHPIRRHLLQEAFCDLFIYIVSAISEEPREAAES